MTKNPSKLFSNLFFRLKQLLALLLIVIMATPTTTLYAAPNFEEAEIWADLPELAPIEVDISEFPELADLESLLAMPELIDAYLMSRADRTGAFSMEDICTASMMETIMAQVTENQLIPLEMAQAQMHQNELSELAPEALEEILRARMEYLSQDFYLRQTAEFALLIDSGTRFTALTESERSLVFRQLNISENANTITIELFNIMERDGFTLSDSVELIRIMSSGL